MHYLGIDVGGTSVKGGVVTADGKIIYKTATAVNGEVLQAVDCVSDKLVEFCKNNELLVERAGIGVPCVFDKTTGIVSYGNNVDFCGVNLREHFSNRHGIYLEIANDAAAAALGEYLFGASKGNENSVLITVGTGVGCGIILDGKIIGSSSLVGELSHTTINVNGRKCTCGKRGCVEAYCSMTALYKDVRRVMAKNKNSLLWKKIDPDKINGVELFNLYEKDYAATEVINRFIGYLGIAVVNIANLLRPDVILLGGGVSAQGDLIIKPLNEYLKHNVFAANIGRDIPVLAAKNGNDAGILGAASLVI